MVAAFSRPFPFAGLPNPSGGVPFQPSETLLLPDDARGSVSDFVAIAERSPRRLRFTRIIEEDFKACTPGARWRCQTTASSITFAVSSNNLVGRYDARNYTATVFVDGVAHSSFSSLSGGATINFGSSSSRLIELIWPYADGMDLLSVTVNAGAQFSTPAARPSGLLAACGDSITQGFTAAKTTDTWAFKLAGLIGRRIMNMGDGGDVAVASYANALTGTGADRVTYMIGYNNFGAQTALATFQAAVEGWINNAEAALPSAKIYVVSPIYSPNSNTLTLAQYRTAVAAAVTAAGGTNVTYVDGLSLMTNNNDRPVDTVHPNDMGSAEIATALAAIVAA